MHSPSQNSARYCLSVPQVAQQAGLKLIVGLNADPEFFMHQKQSSAALESYLNRLLAADLQQARLWSAAPGVTPDGWYISAEIDDLNWRSEAARQPLLTWLNKRAAAD